MKLTQIAQHADDLDRAAAFYQDLTGTAPAGRFDPPGLLFFDLDGVRLLLDHAAPPSLIYLAVDDIDATIARLRDNGVTIDTESHLRFQHENEALGPAGTAEWHAFVRDSEGNLVGLIEQRPNS